MVGGTGVFVWVKVGCVVLVLVLVAVVVLVGAATVVCVAVGPVIDVSVLVKVGVPVAVDVFVGLGGNPVVAVLVISVDVGSINVAVSDPSKSGSAYKVWITKCGSPICGSSCDPWALVSDPVVLSVVSVWNTFPQVGLSIRPSSQDRPLGQKPVSL